MPQTVPNRPTKGAVEPIEARMDRPDCMRAWLPSMLLRRHMLIQSLALRLPCSSLAFWRWWAWASWPWVANW